MQVKSIVPTLRRVDINNHLLVAFHLVIVGMSGQPDQNKDLVSVLNNKLVNTDDYAANQRKIAQIRQLAASMEHSNEQAHQRYVEQELRRRVEEGERAQSVLFLLCWMIDKPCIWLRQMLAKLRQTPNSS
jgi:hypothetical protein